MSIFTKKHSLETSYYPPNKISKSYSLYEVIWRNTFSFLDGDDLLACSSVNKLFNRIINSERFFLKLKAISMALSWADQSFGMIISLNIKYDFVDKLALTGQLEIINYVVRKLNISNKDGKSELSDITQAMEATGLFVKIDILLHYNYQTLTYSIDELKKELHHKYDLLDLNFTALQANTQLIGHSNLKKGIFYFHCNKLKLAALYLDQSKGVKWFNEAKECLLKELTIDPEQDELESYKQEMFEAYAETLSELKEGLWLDKDLIPTDHPFKEEIYYQLALSLLERGSITSIRTILNLLLDESNIAGVHDELYRYFIKNPQIFSGMAVDFDGILTPFYRLQLQILTLSAASNKDSTQEKLAKINQILTGARNLFQNDPLSYYPIALLCHLLQCQLTDNSQQFEEVILSAFNDASVLNSYKISYMFLILHRIKDDALNKKIKNLLNEKVFPSNEYLKVISSISSEEFSQEEFDQGFAWCQKNLLPNEMITFFDTIFNCCIDNPHLPNDFFVNYLNTLTELAKDSDDGSQVLSMISRLIKTVQFSHLEIQTLVQIISDIMDTCLDFEVMSRVIPIIAKLQGYENAYKLCTHPNFSAGEKADLLLIFCTTK